MSADYQVRSNIAVITLNNPPVNGLGLATRSAAVDAIRRAEADTDVRAIVITGAGTAFSGGADIREFNSPKALTEPTLHTLIRTAESAHKPVVAAINGVCMGGGLELALGCHYRVALPGAQVALPEVKLGLLPGAGGTQRLPRVLGVEAALNMIVSGTPVASDKLAGSLFDAVFAAGADIVDGAVDFASTIADVRPLPKVRERRVEAAGRDADVHAVLAAARARVEREAGPFPAPRECVACVTAAVELPFEDGLAFERARFIALTQTIESKALRHAFFAERAASKVPDVAADTPTRPIRTAAVVGAGTMGGGIAMNFANAGIPVMLLETKQDALDKGLGTIRKNYQNTVKKGKLTPEQAEARIALVTGTLDYADIAQADIVIEAVFEDIEVKAGRVPPARRRHEAGRDPGVEHVDARPEPHRRVHAAPAGRDRSAFLQPGQRDEAARDCARCGHRQDRAGHGAGAVQDPQEDWRGLGRVRRLHRQPHGRAIHPPGRLPARRGRAAGTGRPGH